MSDEQPAWRARLAAGHTLNIAHRGARSLAPENTLAAAEAGWLAGADGWELDVSFSADGVPYLLHDETLTRTTDAATRLPHAAPWAADALPWSTLQTLDAGRWFDEQDPFAQRAGGQVMRTFAGEPLPTLEQALRWSRVHHWLVNVEIKEMGTGERAEEGIRRVVALVRALGMEEQVLISSFNHRYLQQVRALSEIPTGALVVSAHTAPLALLAALRADAYHPGAFSVPPEAAQALRAAGVPLLLWTVNEEATLRAYLGAGVNGLITDFPQRLAPLLGPPPDRQR